MSIDKASYVYILRSGSEQTIYPPFTEYKIHLYEARAGGSYRLFSFAESMGITGSTALWYGGGTAVIQAAWWIMGQIRWLKRPISLPILVSCLVASGTTPSEMADRLRGIIRYSTSKVSELVVAWPKTWIGDYWFLPFIIAVFWT